MINEIEEKLKIFLSELKYVKSIDGYMVKLSTLVYDLENICLNDDNCTREKLKYVLKHPLVVKELSNLVCYKDEVLSAVEFNPRFKNLRKYNDVFVDILGTTKCAEGKELERTRDATFRIEHEEVGVENSVRSRKIDTMLKKPLELLRVVNREWLSRLVVIISIVLLIISLLMLIIR